MHTNPKAKSSQRYKLKRSMASNPPDYTGEGAEQSMDYTGESTPQEGRKYLLPHAHIQTSGSRHRRQTAAPAAGLQVFKKYLAGAGDRTLAGSRGQPAPKVEAGRCSDVTAQAKSRTVLVQ
ncbi:hypothetical protein AAFF_G00145370 [Aldrovandia affinis]|uniref:Uncharacterized protein n=1 Tax=Aldrovandia affinis TaxID=143900 RepID=A0AAD7T136_9TELE|nr:hypothetical protein AAFF_G00145370 [Aldrovandia affinis]